MAQDNNALRVLRAMANAQPSGSEHTELEPSDWQSLADMGLIPLYQHLVEQGRLIECPKWHDQLVPLMAMARFETNQRILAMTELLREAHKRQLRVCLLKGMHMANYFYPAAELRPMSDMDVLLPKDEISEFRNLLFDLGYIQKGNHDTEFYRDHHHDVPFYHPGFDVWIEAHHAMLSCKGMFRKLQLLGEYKKSQLQCVDWHGSPVWLVANAVNLLYLIGHWVYEFKVARGVTGLVDMVYILRNCEAETLATELNKLLEKEVALANATHIVLSYLLANNIEQHKLQVILAKIRKHQHIDKIQVSIAHAMINRYLVRQSSEGKIFTAVIIRSVWYAIVASKVRYANLAVISWNFIFPAMNKQRYRPTYQWNRLRNGFRAMFANKAKG